MKVRDLILKLQNCDENLEVVMYYDGNARFIIDGAFFRPNFEYWDSNTATERSTSAVVLCNVNETYRLDEDQDEWIWR